LLPLGKAEILLMDRMSRSRIGTDDCDGFRAGRPAGRDGYSAAVINPRFIKPIDRDMLQAYARRVAAFVTFEDHVKMGGFGSAVLEALDDMGIAFRWCASAGPITLSNMEKLTICAPSMGSPLTMLRRKCCRCSRDASAEPWLPVE